LARGGMQASDLDEGLRTPHCKTPECYKSLIKPPPWTDSIE